MRIGSFEINEPLPELTFPHAFAILRPWIDAGRAGTLVINHLERLFGARELGRLARPGNFYDFTRYRPMSYYDQEGLRQLRIPNTRITYARRASENDLVFLHLREPHMLGEAFTGSVALVLEKLRVERYSLLGSMYDMVPHTRQLLVSGGASVPYLVDTLKQNGISQGRYEGPTTICNLISQRAAELGMETMSLIVHLPQYTELEEDYTGQVRLLEILRSLYGIPVDESVTQRAQKQINDIESAVSRNRKVKDIISQLEALYDNRVAASQQEERPKLSPDIEDFLKEMERRFRQP